MDRKAGCALEGPGAVRLSPPWRRRGLNPWLAFQPAPCPLLAAALGSGAAVSPAEEEEETERGAAPGSGFRTNAEQPRAAPGGRPSSPAPRSTVMAHEEGRARAAAAHVIISVITYFMNFICLVFSISVSELSIFKPNNEYTHYSILSEGSSEKATCKL